MAEEWFYIVPKEETVEKGSKGSGWFAPPRGTHGATADQGTLSDGARKAVEKYTNSILAFGKNTGKEAATAIDKDGNPIGKKLVVGNRNGADISSLLTGEEHIIIHNHPSSASFSPSDIGLLQYSNAKHLVVIGHDGTLYRLSRTGKTKFTTSTFAPTELKQIEYRWNVAKGRTTDKFKERVEQGKINASHAWKEHSHEIMQQVSQDFKLDYERILP